MRPRHSAPSIFSDAAKTSVSRRQSITARGNAITFDFGHRVSRSPEAALATASFWLNTDRPPDHARVLWVGAGTKDTGLSLTQLTFQVTHATDSDTNTERDYIIAELTKNCVIVDVNSCQSGQRLPTERVNHYITDGEVTVASLAPPSQTS